MTHNEEMAIHLHHLAVDFLAKTSCYPREVILSVQERLKVEASRSPGDDSVALRCIANSLELYLQD